MSFTRKINKKIKIFVSKIILFFLFKGFKLTYKFDKQVKSEIDNWKDGFIVKIDTGIKDLNLIMKKEKGKLIKLKQAKISDIEIVFKSLDVALLMFTGRLGVSKAYAEHRFTLKGEISKAMSFVRCIDIVEAYLFPRIITKNILKAQPKKSMGLFRTYLIVLFV